MQIIFSVFILLTLIFYHDRVVNAQENLSPIQKPGMYSFPSDLKTFLSPFVSFRGSWADEGKPYDLRFPNYVLIECSHFPSENARCEIASAYGGINGSGLGVSLEPFSVREWTIDEISAVSSSTCESSHLTIIRESRRVILTKIPIGSTDIFCKNVSVKTSSQNLVEGMKVWNEKYLK